MLALYNPCTLFAMTSPPPYPHHIALPLVSVMYQLTLRVLSLPNPKTATNLCSVHEHENKSHHSFKVIVVATTDLMICILKF